MKYYVKIALQHLAMGLIIPIAIVWKIQNGLTLPEAVLTESIVLLVTALADLPAGFIANTTNNKRSLVFAAVMHLVGMALLLIGGSLGVFVAAAVATGIGWAFVSGADEAYLYDDFIADKSMYKHNFSTVTIVDEVFTVVGMLVASLTIALGAGLRPLFFSASILLIIHLIYTLTVLPPSKLHLNESVGPITKDKTFSLRLLKQKEVISILPLMIAFAVIYEAGRPLWQPQLQRLGVDLASFGILFSLFKLASIGGSIFSLRRKFKMRDLAIVFIVMLVSLIAFGLPFKAISIVALCAYLFTENYFRIYMSTILNNNITTNRAAVLSFGSVIKNATGALIIFGAGILSSSSILLALIAIATIKIPAVIITLRSSDIR